jgi:hypothetical protein
VFAGFTAEISEKLEEDEVFKLDLLSIAAHLEFGLTVCSVTSSLTVIFVT